MSSTRAPRLLTLTLLALSLLALAAPAAWADEVFVLDNDYVVRGQVVRETEDRLIVRLTGLMERNTVTLRRSEIVRRYEQGGPSSPPVARSGDADKPASGGSDLAAQVPAGGMPRTTRYDEVGAVAITPPTDDPRDGDPPLARENFGERLARVTRLAFPSSFEGRLLVALLLLVALATVVGGGARVLGMKSPSLHSSTSLGLMLGVFLLGDILMHEEVLRADRALWILPLQAAAWLGTARTVLDAPLAKVVPLFSLVLFVATCFVFLTGSLLVAL
ncbi:MAG: hypothetical protein O2894_11105 [Planctomycetota bacterium]|nr:hypothetical protein [Planctomycetota bacterium]